MSRWGSHNKNSKMTNINNFVPRKHGHIVATELSRAQLCSVQSHEPDTRSWHLPPSLDVFTVTWSWHVDLARDHVSRHCYVVLSLGSDKGSSQWYCLFKWSCHETLSLGSVTCHVKGSCHVVLLRGHVKGSCYVILSRDPVTWSCHVVLSSDPVTWSVKWSCHVVLSRGHVTWSCLSYTFIVTYGHIMDNFTQNNLDKNHRLFTRT